MRAPFLLPLLVPALLAQAPAKDPSTRKAEAAARLADYITWPQGRPGSPVVLGVYGSSAVSAALRAFLATPEGHRLNVQLRPLRNLYQVETCDILLICQADEDQVAEILKRLRGRPVLTVGDAPGLAESGVMLSFAEAGDRIRFDANLEAAGRAGLRLSAHLLTRCRIVEAS